MRLMKWRSGTGGGGSCGIQRFRSEPPKQYENDNDDKDETDDADATMPEAVRSRQNGH
jgi:hypothetical protein